MNKQKQHKILVNETLKKYGHTKTSRSLYTNPTGQCNHRTMNVRFGLCRGSPDIVGYESVEITPEMVGTKVAVFVGIEVKTGSGRLRKEQRMFLDSLKNAGGYAYTSRYDDGEPLLLEH